MKKKVFRERYNMVNGKGEVVKENLTLEEVKEIVKDAYVNTIITGNAKEIVINAVDSKGEPKKRGRKKSVK